MCHEHAPAVDRLDCAACRASVSTSVVALDRVWTHVAAAAFAPERGVVERIAARLLRSPGLARALLTTRQTSCRRSRRRNRPSMRAGSGFMTAGSTMLAPSKWRCVPD